MWLPITIIAMLFCAVSEIISTKAVSAEKKFNIFKLRISAIFVEEVLLLFLWVFYYRGTGTNPWLITIENPLLILAASLNVLEIFFYLQALKHIGLTIQEAYSGVSNILLFCGMVFINLVYGKIADVREMLVPSKLILIVILLAVSFILPKVNSSVKKEVAEISNLNKRNVILGLLYTFIGYVCESVEVLISTYLLAESDISSIDYISAGFFVALFWGIAFYAILYFKTRKVFHPLKKENFLYMLYGVLNALYLILYIYGASLAPVQSSIFWTAYPIIPIIGSILFLKERYSVKQYICIAMIAVSSMTFGLIDLAAR